jgi:hypothetical protein
MLLVAVARQLQLWSMELLMLSVVQQALLVGSLALPAAALILEAQLQRVLLLVQSRPISAVAAVAT